MSLPYYIYTYRLKDTHTDHFVAGIPLDAVVGSKTSVYTGCFTTDWRDLYAKDPDQWPSYAATGVSTLSMCANRISWFFDLRGTSANVDTACSSSLVALDMACRDLQTGEATMVRKDRFHLIYSYYNRDNEIY